MTAIELLKRVYESRACSHLEYDLMTAIADFLKEPPTVVNVLLHGVQVVSVSGPFRPTEAASFAKIATAVGGVRVTSIRVSHPQQQKEVTDKIKLDRVKPHHHNWK
jgi:hypothetical protein